MSNLNQENDQSQTKQGSGTGKAILSFIAGAITARTASKLVQAAASIDVIQTPASSAAQFDSSPLKACRADIVALVQRISSAPTVSYFMQFSSIIPVAVAGHVVVQKSIPIRERAFKQVILRHSGMVSRSGTVIPPDHIPLCLQMEVIGGIMNSAAIPGSQVYQKLRHEKSFKQRFHARDYYGYLAEGINNYLSCVDPSVSKTIGQLYYDQGIRSIADLFLEVPVYTTGIAEADRYITDGFQRSYQFFFDPSSTFFAWSSVDTRPASNV